MTTKIMLLGTVLAVSALSLPLIITEFSPKPDLPPILNHDLIDEAVKLGCNEPSLNHLIQYSNLLHDSFDGNYIIATIGLPDGLSQNELDECVQIILEKHDSLD
ncbi:MAG: hypothetical protein J4F36_06965 [Nitrosopumilaceae archaeon]|nr:hypothetical protein [Nitrosopumilaceae archaeon]